MEATNISLVSVNAIPSDYMPYPSSYFRREDSEDIGGIVSHFGLNDYQSQENISDIIVSEKFVEYHAEKQKTELFRLHLNNGKYVAHGRAQTDVLGGTLTSFEGLYHEVADDRLKGKDRTIKILPREKGEYELTASTEVVLQEAASFSIYIRPRSGQTQFDYTDLNNPVLLSAGEKIFQDVLEIIHNAGTQELIGTIKDKYSHTVFVKLKAFADHVKKHDLNINLDYYSPVSRQKWDEKIDIVSANNILNTLEKTVVTIPENKFDVIGKFTALNCKTKHYSFSSNHEEEFTGYFDDLLKETIPTLTFVDLYTVTIDRKEVKNIADADFKPTDTILAVFIKK